MLGQICRKNVDYVLKVIGFIVTSENIVSVVSGPGLGVPMWALVNMAPKSNISSKRMYKLFQTVNALFC